MNNMDKPLIAPITEPTGILFEVINDHVGVIRISKVVDYYGKTQHEAGLCFETERYFRDYFVSKAFDLGFTSLIIDLSEVTDFDSSGLWAVYESHKKCLDAGGKAVFVITNLNIIRMLTITKTIDKLMVVSEFGDALGMFG